MHVKEVAVRITYIILGLVLSLSLIKAANERNNQQLLTEEKIKEIEKKALDDILMIKQTITEGNGDEHKTELERLKKLTQNIQSNTAIAITKTNEIQKALEEEEAELQNLAENENLVKACDILNHAASKSNPPNIMIEKSSMEYKYFTITKEHRMGVHLLEQSKDLCSKIKKLSELFQKYTPTKDALNIAKNKYFEAMNTEALKYIEEADRFFNGLSDPRSIKNKHSFTPPADNTEKLQSLYNSILPSIFADKEQIEKYTQALKKMGEKRSKQLLANTLHDLFQYQKNGKNGMIAQTREFYKGLRIKIIFPYKECLSQRFKPFCIRFANNVSSKLSAIQTAAIALLEMLQPGIDNPTSVTQDQITKKLLDAIAEIQGESGQKGYKVICELMGQDELDVNAIKRWYLYDTSPEQKSQTKETQSASSEKAAKSLAGLEVLLKYFNNLRTLQEVLFLLFNKLDVPYIQHKKRKPEDIDLTDWLSSICIVTDAQVLILQTALHNQQSLLRKEEEQKKNEKSLSYAELSDLLSLWARMYRVYGYAEEKCIFLQHGKKILASEFRYSDDLAKQFLMSFTTCAESVIDNYQEVLSLRSNEKYTSEYIQLEREVKNISEILKEIHSATENDFLGVSITESGLSNFSMAYVDLDIDNSLYQDLLEDIDLKLKILVAKETSEIERNYIERQIRCALDIIKNLVDPEKLGTTELAKAIDKFKKKLTETMKKRKERLESIYRNFISAVRYLYNCPSRFIKTRETIERLKHVKSSQDSGRTSFTQNPPTNPHPQDPLTNLHPQDPPTDIHPQDPPTNPHPQDEPINLHPQDPPTNPHPQDALTNLHPQDPPTNLHSQDALSVSPDKGNSKIIVIVIAVLAIAIAVLVAFYYFFMKKA